MKYRVKTSDKWFIRGVVCACAEICKSHDEPTIASNTLRGLGIDRDYAIKSKCFEEDIRVLDENECWSKDIEVVITYSAIGR